MEEDAPPHDRRCVQKEQPLPDGSEAVPAGLMGRLSSRKTLLRILAVAFVVAITVSIFVFRDRIEQFESYGYLGAFLIALVTSATIILPVPGIVLIGALGAVYNPWLIGLMAGLGSALGEMTGYLAGYTGQVAVKDNPTYQRVEGWMHRRGFLVILLLSFIPNPLFDLAGGTSGILRYPVWKFLIACFLGKGVRYALIAMGVSWIAPTCSP